MLEDMCVSLLCEGLVKWQHVETNVNMVQRIQVMYRYLCSTNLEWEELMTELKSKQKPDLFQLCYRAVTILREEPGRHDEYILNEMLSELQHYTG